MRRASDWLHSACCRHEVPPTVIDRLELCLNEALANIIDHGGSTALAAPIKLVLEVDPGGGTARVAVCDAGAAFDPFSVAAGAAPKTLEDAPVGGLGLVMIKRCADWTDYRRQGERNQLTFGVRWSPP